MSGGNALTGSFAYQRLLGAVRQSGFLDPVICVQGGGAKGGWQGGVLNSLLNDTRIHPVAAFGTSAGSINSWLISTKLCNRAHDPFSEFWARIPEGRWGTILRLGPKALLRGPRAVVDFAFGYFGRTRSPHTALISFQSFQREIRRLLPVHPAKIHTYMYATNTQDTEPPDILDGQNLCTFHFRPGDVDAEVQVDGVTQRITFDKSIAASCCLPFVEPLTVGTARFADGGFYSNLPANIAAFQGALGGDCIICILATPLGDMRPTDDYVDFRTTVLLNHLRQLQLKYRLVPAQMGPGAHAGPAIANIPIFIISPATPLASKLMDGFVYPSKMMSDITAGVEQGHRFLNAVEALFNGHPTALTEYDLLQIRIPPVPATPAHLNGWWVPWVNANWAKT